MAKKRRKPNLKKPNSMTWRIKADNAWRDAPGPKCCEICEQRGTVKPGVQIQNHHLISRTNLRYRHRLENRIRLCSQHHTMGQYRVKEVAHGDLSQVEAFMEWLRLHKPDQFAWWMLHKDDKRLRDESYQASFERIKKLSQNG